MVFCNLLFVDDKKAFYAIGGSPEDLTGELLIDTEAGTYELLKAPENSKVYGVHIGAMLRKYQSLFEKGTFKDRIAYQIG